MSWRSSFHSKHSHYADISCNTQQFKTVVCLSCKLITLRNFSLGKPFTLQVLSRLAAAEIHQGFYAALLIRKRRVGDVHLINKIIDFANHSTVVSLRGKISYSVEAGYFLMRQPDIPTLTISLYDS